MVEKNVEIEAKPHLGITYRKLAVKSNIQESSPEENFDMWIVSFIEIPKAAKNWNCISL